MYFIQHCFNCRPSDCVGGCWHRTQDCALWHWQSDALTFRLDPSHSAAISHPHSAISHPQLGYISSTARLYLIHTRLYLIHSRLDLIHNKVLFIYIGIFSVSLEPTGHRFSFSRSFPESQIRFGHNYCQFARYLPSFSSANPPRHAPCL